MLLKKHQLSLPCSCNKGKKAKQNPKETLSVNVNPVSENILVIFTIGIPDQVNIEDSLVRTWNSKLMLNTNVLTRSETTFGSQSLLKH